jgi:3-isopropylmalate dehydrogenase
MKLVVWPGDGIGPETMAVTVEVLHAVSHQFYLGLSLNLDVAGHESLKRFGAAVTSELLAKA